MGKRFFQTVSLSVLILVAAETATFGQTYCTGQYKPLPSQQCITVSVYSPNKVLHSISLINPDYHIRQVDIPLVPGTQKGQYVSKNLTVISAHHYQGIKGNSLTYQVMFPKLEVVSNQGSCGSLTVYAVGNNPSSNLQPVQLNVTFQNAPPTQHSKQKNLKNLGNPRYVCSITSKS